MNTFAKRSIALRLAASALFWSFVILLAAGLILTALYRETTERAFDERLLVYANDLASDLLQPGDPEKAELATMGEVRFYLPLSGWYWQVGRIGAAARDIRASRSLVGGQVPPLDADPDALFGQIRKGYAEGPDERNLRVVERDIDLGEDGRFVVRVGIRSDEIDRDVQRFVFALTATFSALGIALAATTLLQIRFGLEPLNRLRAAVTSVRRGEAERIQGAYPQDIAPLAQELNLLLDSNKDILERARTQVGNLAHALKTPLSVVTNEAASTNSPVAETIREQAAIMSDQINYYLDRARAAALAGALGAVTEIEPVVAGLARAFAKIHRDRELEIDVAVPAGARFRGERQDLEEMIGNLMDNACKWSRSRVSLRVEDDDASRATIRVVIEDDGPGLPEAVRADMLKRGRRLDDSKPGSGLGLAIVADLAALHRGELVLSDATLGGLRATLTLPGEASG